VFILVPVPSPFTALCPRGAKLVVPSEDYSHGPPHWQLPLAPALFGERAKSPKQIKNMNTTNQNNNVTAAPSVTIAPRNPARGVLNFVVTLTTHKDVRSYPCRSTESAIKLAERFIAGVSRNSQATADATKPRPASGGQSGSDPSTLNAQPSTPAAVAA
jgi:hypothetical protein